MNQMLTAFTPAVSEEIFDLRPDYFAISVVADGIVNVANHPLVERYVDETVTRPVRAPWAEGHLEAWRAAYRAFGAKPQRTPSSADALLMRLGKDGRLPTINAVVDLYNAISVRYAIPVGGENIAAYVGPPRLVCASGAEFFETMKDGKPVAEPVPTGEVVWTDDRGVTCRRWNWRQGIRTRIDLHTCFAWFVLDRLEPMPLDAAADAGVELKAMLRQICPAAQVSVRRIDRAGTTKIS